MIYKTYKKANVPQKDHKRGRERWREEDGEGAGVGGNENGERSSGFRC
jgi:hypothetical protein